jgi:hypothetical protein
MALGLKEGAVKRGRAEDNFAEATVSMEPGTTQGQMAVASDTIATQAGLTQRLMSKNVIVTLDKPYMGDPQKTVVLVYGFGEATPNGPDSYQEQGGTNPVPASERLFSQDASFAAPRWEPGKPNHWHLRFEEGPLGDCACGQDPETVVGREAIMPGPVARHWFGDWDVAYYELQASKGIRLENWLKRTWHRDRVATENWGGYEMDFPVGVQVYDQRGAVNVRALRKYGAPNIPHVTIHRLDTMMRKLPNTKAVIWDIFKWEDALDKSPRMHFFDNKLEASGAQMYTQDDLQKMIALGVQAALAAERAATKGKTA